MTGAAAQRRCSSRRQRSSLALAVLVSCAAPKPLSAPLPTAPVLPTAAQAAGLASAAELARGTDTAFRALLSHPDAQVRTRAALAAGRIADPGSTDALAQLLRDPLAGPTAAWALGRVPEGEPALVTCVRSNAGPAPACARALGGGARSPASLEALTAALAGPADLAGAAALALGVYARTGGPQAPEAVGRLSAPALLLALARPEPEVKRGAAYALGRLPKLPPAPAGPLEAALVSALSQPDPELRALAARAWGKQALAASGLASALADPDWRVRVEAARALGAAQGGASAIATWLPAYARTAGTASGPLEAKWSHPLVALLETAAQARVPLDLVPLPAQLAAPTPAATVAVRCAAAAARDRLAFALEQTPLCAGDLEPAWRGRARAGALAAELFSELPAATPEPTRAPLLAAVQAALRDEDGRVRARTAAASGPPLGDQLIGLLGDSDPFVVATAAGQLSEDPLLASPAGSSALAALARLAHAHEDPSGSAESDALAALAALLATSATSGPQPTPTAPPSRPPPAPAPRAAALATLRALLPTPSLPLHRAVALALAKLGAPPLPALSPPPPSIPEPARLGLPGQGPRAHVLRLHTTLGDLVLRLRSADGEAPLTSVALASLASKKFYDSLVFHRVVPDFVVQGGDPRGDGDGGPGWALPDEHTPLRFLRGTLGIATSGPETGGSQLFVCHSAQPHLDGRYTVAGELESGAEVLDALHVGDEILSVLVE